MEAVVITTLFKSDEDSMCEFRWKIVSFSDSEKKLEFIAFWKSFKLVRELKMLSNNTFLSPTASKCNNFATDIKSGNEKSFKIFFFYA